MTVSIGMDKVQKHMTEKILDLTLEIIYLLTGEDYKLVKKPVTANRPREGSPPIMEPPPRCLTTELNSAKILDVIQKMIGILTGEVPIRCQDVTVYLSMEEWEYLEGHKDLYKDVVMEDEPDGSRKRNPPQRCPRPRDSTQEDHEIPHHDQGEDLIDIKVEVKAEKDHETHMRCDQNVKEGETKEPVKEEGPTDGSRKRNPPQRRPRPRESAQEDLSISHKSDGENATKEEVKEEEVGGMEEFSEEHKRGSRGVSMKPFHDVKPPATCPRPWNSQLEDLPLPRHDRGEEGLNIKAEIKEEDVEMEVSDYRPSTVDVGVTKLEQVESQPISTTDGCDVRNTSERHLILSADCKSQDDVITQDFRCVLEKSFTENNQQQRNHTPEHPYSCSECGESFAEKKSLAKHQRVHTVDRPFCCSECGKCYARKTCLLLHQRTHTCERPYSCSECGKTFIQKNVLVQHQRIHSGERPYSCTECGKSFTRKGSLTAHRRIHTGERPYSCADCGKSFAYSQAFLTHQRVHNG